MASYPSPDREGGGQRNRSLTVAALIRETEREDLAGTKHWCFVTHRPSGSVHAVSRPYTALEQCTTAVRRFKTVGIIARERSHTNRFDHGILSAGSIRTGGEASLGILAGIDEAGYGPTLGPLVVTGAEFRVPDELLHACLWETLRESCTQTPQRKGRRVTIADSKKLYTSRGGMAPLERAALVMLAVAGHRPTSMRGLLDLLAPDASRALDQYPWYAGADISLPMCQDVGDIPTRANAVRLDCAGPGVDLAGIHCEVLLAGHFNRLVRKTRNKAAVMLGLALRLIDRIIRSSPREKVRVCVDRLGGRVHYRDSLTTAMPEFELQILEESPARSSYRLSREAQVCDIEFVTSGETHHFPVALASIVSKYVRELHMRAFNGFWTAQQADLRPTAGYFTDAKRWVKEASRTLDRLKVDRGMLLRER